MDATVRVLEDAVHADWVDYNGHMRDGYYVVAFSAGIDALMDRLGMDAAYREATGCTLYSADVHVNFAREVHEGAAFAVDARILDHDAKRLHLFLWMRDAAGEVLATEETMQLHVDQGAGPAVAPFRAEVASRVEAMAKAHAPAGRPPEAGRSIGIRRRG